MSKVKYYYDGGPLGDYCASHDIKENTIIKGISRKKIQKYKNYSDQDLVNMVVENYNKSYLYFYDGMTLR